MTHPHGVTRASPQQPRPPARCLPPATAGLHIPPRRGAGGPCPPGRPFRCRRAAAGGLPRGLPGRRKAPGLLLQLQRARARAGAGAGAGGSGAGPRGRAVAVLEPEPEPEPCGRRAAARRAGDSSSPAAAAAAMRSEAVAWPAVSSQAASLLEEAADLLVLHRDFAAAVEKCEAGCDSLGPGSGPAPERCGRGGRRWEALAAAASAPGCLPSASPVCVSVCCCLFV